MNVWPQIAASAATAPSRTLYWTTPRSSAVRDGDWKLIVTPAPEGKSGKVELFDLAKDPKETTDLASGMPEKVKALKVKLAAMAKADGDARVKD